MAGEAWLPELKPRKPVSQIHGAEGVVQSQCPLPWNGLGTDGDRQLHVDPDHPFHDLSAHSTERLGSSTLSRENEVLQRRLMVLNQEQQGELDRLNKVLDVAKRNGNQLFIENIEREIAAIERGEHSPLIADYLTEEERSGKRPGLLP